MVLVAAVGGVLTIGAIVHRAVTDLIAATESAATTIAASMDGFWTGLPTQQPTFVDLEALLAAEGLDKDPEFSELVLESDLPVVHTY